MDPKINETNITIAVINGPNMNLLGEREISHYGVETLKQIEERLYKISEQLSVKLLTFQSNHEGDIVDFIQDKRKILDGIIINPAALTKSSYAVAEALSAAGIPFVEVHLSNIFAREAWHSESIFSSRAVGTITGFKGFVYELGLYGILDYLKISPN